MGLAENDGIRVKYALEIFNVKPLSLFQIYSSKQHRRPRGPGMMISQILVDPDDSDFVI